MTPVVFIWGNSFVVMGLKKTILTGWLTAQLLKNHHKSTKWPMPKFLYHILWTALSGSHSCCRVRSVKDMKSQQTYKNKPLLSNYLHIPSLYGRSCAKSNKIKCESNRNEYRCRNWLNRWIWIYFCSEIRPLGSKLSLYDVPTHLLFAIDWILFSFQSSWK